MRKGTLQLIGSKFGRLTFVEVAETLKKGISRGVFLCDCGNKITLGVASVKNGNTISCGCFRKEVSSKKATSHGLSKHPLYSIWAGMIARCYNPKERCYPRYGGIGVKMSDEWRNDFKSFYDWAMANGWNKTLQIDKDIIPKSLGVKERVYSKEMCSIVTPMENSSNTSKNVLIRHNGKVYTMSQLARELNIKNATFSYRIRKGWKVSDVINTPVGKFTGSNRFVPQSNFINHSFGYINQNNQSQPQPMMA